MKEITVGIHLRYPIRGVRPGKIKDEAFHAVRREAVSLRSFSGDEVPLVARIDGDYRGRSMCWHDRSMEGGHKTDLRHLDGHFYRRAWVARTGEAGSPAYRSGEILADERGTSITGENYDAHWLKGFVDEADPRLRYGPERVARDARAEVMTEADLVRMLSDAPVRANWGHQTNPYAFPDPILVASEAAEEMPVLRKVTVDHSDAHLTHLQEVLQGLIVVDGEVWREVAQPIYIIDMDRQSHDIEVVNESWAYELGKPNAFALSDFDAVRATRERLSAGREIQWEYMMGEQEVLDPSPFSIDMKRVIEGLGKTSFDMREGMAWRRGSEAARPLQFLHSAGREGLRSWMRFRDAVADPEASIDEKAQALSDFYDRCGSIGQYHHGFENALAILDRLGLKDLPAIKAEEQAAKEAWNREYGR